MSKEAYVSVKEVIMTAPSTNNVSNTSNIGGVIVSKVGMTATVATQELEILKSTN